MLNNHMQAKEITRISPHSSNRIRKIVINRIRKSDFIGIHLYQLAPIKSINKPKNASEKNIVKFYLINFFIVYLLFFINWN